jgi:hypothetical protein
VTGTLPELHSTVQPHRVSRSSSIRSSGWVSRSRQLTRLTKLLCPPYGSTAFASEPIDQHTNGPLYSFIAYCVTIFRNLNERASSCGPGRVEKCRREESLRPISPKRKWVQGWWHAETWGNAKCLLRHISADPDPRRRMLRHAQANVPSPPTLRYPIR